jgi:hypothetical protein
LKALNLHIMAAITIILFFIPIAIVLLRKLWADKFLRLYSIYSVIEGLVNLLDYIPGIPNGFIAQVNIVYNMLDFPMMLFLVYHIAAPEKFKQFIKVSIGLYLLFQLYYVFKLGIQYDAIKFPMGLGLLLLIGSVLWMLATYLQHPDLQNRQKVYMVILAAIFFDYGTFVVIYIFDYFMGDTSGANKDNLILYYASSIVGMLITIAGLLLIRNKPKAKKPRQEIFQGRQPIIEIY